MHVTFDSLKTFYNILIQKLKNHRGNWNQNDPTADDYIKNRPFYAEIKKEVILDNYTSEIYNEEYATEHPKCNFIPGNSYSVVWNGELFENMICYSDEGYNVIGGGDGYPFYIDDDGRNSLYIESNEQDWCVSIYTISEFVHQIDKKYIPESDRKVLKVYTCYSDRADDGTGANVPALTPDNILSWGGTNWEDYVTAADLANAESVIVFEGQTNVGVPANVSYYKDTGGNDYAIITFYSEYDGGIRTLYSRGPERDVVFATEDYVDSNINEAIGDISISSITENLTDAQKTTVRNNIGAGTSNFSGSYKDLTDTPEISQADWLMGDANSNAYIKNKPFGYEYELEEIEGEHSLYPYKATDFCSGTLDESTGLYVKDFTFVRYPFDPNKVQYYFIVNGNPTISTCNVFKKNNTDSQELVGVGNASLAIPDINVCHTDTGWEDIRDTGEDWLILQKKGFKYSLITTRPDIQITGVYKVISESINQLNEKYIPDTIARVADIPTAIKSYVDDAILGGAW